MSAMRRLRWPAFLGFLLLWVSASALLVAAGATLGLAVATALGGIALNGLLFMLPRRAGNSAMTNREAACRCATSMDEGRSFEVMPGLPPYGPPAHVFSPTGQGAHREGVVVRFHFANGGIWTGNFQPGNGQATGAYPHPDSQHVVIASGGQIYVVDPDAPDDVVLLDAAVRSVFQVASPQALLFADDIGLTYVDAIGNRWRTRRLAWDGIRNLSSTDKTIRGDARHFDGSWHTFTVDRTTGVVHGGAYEETRVRWYHKWHATALRLGYWARRAIF